MTRPWRLGLAAAAVAAVAVTGTALLAGRAPAATPADAIAARQREDAARLQLLAAACDALDRAARVRGAWPQERAQLASVLTAAGAWAQPDPAAGLEPARVRRALARLQLARREAGEPADARIGSLLAAGAAPAWACLGAVAASAAPGGAGLVLAADADAAAALAEPATCDLLLAACAPAPLLIAAARERLLQDPGAFWPRIHLGRDALRRGEWSEVRGHALVALGRESASRWPRLLLAHADVAAGDWASALIDATHAAAVVDDAEAAAIQAVALVRLGRPAEAAERAASTGVAELLRRHAGARQGDPLERIAEAAAAAGLSPRP